MISSRARHIAAHPLVLAAAGLVALNDFVLRLLWPESWWTGKLSTLAAAFALPLLLAGLMACIFPRREKFAAGLAFGTVLVGLILLKASPLTNAWLTGILPIRAVADPGDLLALIPWASALWLYFDRRFTPPVMRKRTAIFLIPLAAFFLLADAAAPEYGAACLSEQDNGLVVRGMYQAYQSEDGGQTWQTTQISEPGSCSPAQSEQPLEFSAPDGTRYRVELGGAVERAAKDQAWETIYSGSVLPEPEQVYIRRTLPGNLFYRPGPLDARLVPGGNNLVLAMGVEGILIVPPAGSLEWVALGPYHHNQLRSAGVDGYLFLLSGELWLAGAAALTWLATAALRLRRSKWQLVLVILGWIIVLAAGTAQHPDINTGYLAAFSGMSLVVAFAWAVVLVMVAFFRQRGRPLHPLTRRVLFVPIFMVVFILPYVAWALGLLPLYWFAQAAALALTVAMVGLVN
jgi:hypothetical protein